MMAAIEEASVEGGVDGDEDQGEVVRQVAARGGGGEQ